MRIDSPAVNGPSTFVVNSASAAVKVTQTGSGPALVVEDEAADTTPFTVDTSGNVTASGTLTSTGGISGGTF